MVTINLPLSDEELEYQLTLAFSHMEKAEDAENTML